MTNASVLSEKKLQLEKSLLINFYNFRSEASKGNFLEALADDFFFIIFTAYHCFDVDPANHKTSTR